MNISILGCGWLGLPLAKELLKEQHRVKGSVTGQEKMQHLREEGITPYLLKVLPEGVQGDLSSFLADADLLIIDIPPGLRRDPQADFLGIIDRIRIFLEKSPVEKLIFVSSTSVYKDTEDFPVYTEKDPPTGTSEAAKQLIASENILINNEHFKTTIIRFGGLFGPGRHPVKFLAGRSLVKNPKAPVNLIHQKDCLSIIKQVIEKEAWGEIFHAVYPDHPNKDDYYFRKAREKNIPAPEFDLSSPSKGKIISSEKIERELGLHLEKKI